MPLLYSPKTDPQEGLEPPTSLIGTFDESTGYHRAASPLCPLRDSIRVLRGHNEWTGMRQNENSPLIVSNQRAVG